MPRLISFSMTEQAFLDGSKDVTRRMGWEFLTPGTELYAVRKAMGLKRGEMIEIIGRIQVIDVRREPLHRLISDRRYGWREVRREGFAGMTPEEFIAFFIKGHRGCNPATIVTRIEFKKLPGSPR